MERPNNIKSPGEQKVEEYAERIRNGESKEEIVKDLPPSFRNAIEAVFAVPPEREIEETDEQKIESLRKELLALSKDGGEDPLSTFIGKHGTTMEGLMWWYQYQNKEAENLEKEGKFEWGQERIYFDIPLDRVGDMRDIVSKVAVAARVPIAFKLLDAKSTALEYQDGTETRFVANFVSLADAQTFYTSLRESTEYQALIADRTVDYKGIRIDSKAEYASGLREQRGALERVMNAVRTGDRYTFVSESGREISISAEDYEMFKSQFDASTEKLEESRSSWSRVLADRTMPPI